MADEISPLLLSIQLETDRLTEQANGVQQQLGQIGQAAQQSTSPLSGLGTALGGLAQKALAFAGVGLSVHWLEDAAKGAVEAHKEMVLFEGQLQRSTGATRAQIDAVNTDIKSLSDLSAVSGGDIRNSFEKLVTITGDLNKSMELQAVAMDVAAGTGKPLAVVTTMIGRGATGSVAALNRLVPGISAVKDPMAKLAETFKGAAKEAGNNDPYAKMDLLMGHLKKTIGTALLPAVDAALEIMKQLAPTLEGLAVPIGQVVKSLAPFAVQLVKALIPALKELLPPIMKLVVALLPPLIKLFNSLMPFIMVLADLLVALLPLILPIVDAFAALFDVIANYVVNWLKVLISWLQPLAKWLGEVLTNLMDFFGIKPKAEIDVSGVHDAATAYVSLTEAQNANASAASKNASANAAAAKKTSSSTGGGSGSTTPSFTIQDLKKAQRDYQKGIAELTRQADDEVVRLTADHAKKIGDIMKSGANTLGEIVRQSQDKLRDAFKNVTQINAGEMFIQASASITNFVAMLKDKLTASKRLAQDAANLAAAGYSQTFIEQIIAQGSEVGDQLTKQLLAATPEQAAQIQSLFSDVNSESLHAVDDVAKKITEQQGLATEELRDAYLKAQTELTTALQAENDAYATAMVDVQTKLTNAIQAQTDTLKKAMRTAEKEIGDSASRILKHLRSLIGAASSTDLSAVIDTTTPAPTTYGVTGTPTSSVTYQGAPINVSISVSTNATADDIAAAVSNAIKYNLPYTVAGAA